MSFREGPPSWLREQHPGPILVGWMPCQCQRAGGGHRRYDLACCGQVFVVDCREARTPTPCR